MLSHEEKYYEWLNLTKISFAFLVLIFVKGWERFIYSEICSEDGRVIHLNRFTVPMYGSIW